MQLRYLVTPSTMASAPDGLEVGCASGVTALFAHGTVTSSPLNSRNSVGMCTPAAHRSKSAFVLIPDRIDSHEYDVVIRPERTCPWLTRSGRLPNNES
ncbi:hypothetical protein GCM10022222_08770 [Amycolatopsis ultiminotia]|uniref:Uncharacterized protein n=1 Tax=Amycolatopsis ultiminotia TaxID=543629 RepID=A0ABP6V701_9PSEU